MKKKDSLKRAAPKLDLEKIEVDVLSKSMLNGIQGGYKTMPGLETCLEFNCPQWTLMTQAPGTHCQYPNSLGTNCDYCCTGGVYC